MCCTLAGEVMVDALRNSSVRICDSGVNLVYVGVEVVLAAVAIFGNALALIVWWKAKSIRTRRHNVYIASLSLADLLVGGIGIPGAVLNHYGLPSAFYPCLLINSSLLALCTVSIFSLTSVAIDRYVAVVHPLWYKRKAGTNSLWVNLSIVGSWGFGLLLGLLPMMGWNLGPSDSGDCVFMEIIDLHYLVFLLFLTILGPAVLISAAYTRIYIVLRKRLLACQRRSSSVATAASMSVDSVLEVHETQAQAASSEPPHSPTVLDLLCVRPTWGNLLALDTSHLTVDLESRKPSPPPRSVSVTTANGVVSPRKQIVLNLSLEVKAARSVMVLVLAFLVCWLPLYVSNALMFFDPGECPIPKMVIEAFILLSHANSALNPFLYAYAIADFRSGLKRLFSCQ